MLLAMGINEFLRICKFNPKYTYVASDYTAFFNLIEKIAILWDNSFWQTLNNAVPQSTYKLK